MQENLRHSIATQLTDVSHKISTVLFNNYSDSEGLESFIVIAQNSREVLDIYQGPGEMICVEKYANLVSLTRNEPISSTLVFPRNVHKVVKDML